MRQHFVRRSGGRKLIVFTLGWGADHRVVEHILPDGYDAVCLYDYRDAATLGNLPLEFSPTDYDRCHLFAWSFGVWAAERIFEGARFTRAVAFNGTPYPVHERYGIEPRRMSVTIRGIVAAGTDAFARRAYGDRYGEMKGILFPRPAGENIAELEALDAASREPYTPSLGWNKAVVGSQDAIFPPHNMEHYWREVAKIETETLPLYHYPFTRTEILKNELERE